eukprot:TRINITY_DN9719_c0_g1_i1.p1 TRINITY_DN9719_c0_g1~~TRINITY_DN9719_c0_g1_i1.p1  ORF type:complete len:140 (-),score=50.17 TRINITY_DN9719_c0_g1_i1:65-484(-)
MDFIRVIIFKGAIAFGGAFATAWRSGRKNAEKSGLKSTVGKKILMDKMEAIKILDLDAKYTKVQIEEKFTKLFELNRPEVGGSEFIQAKFANAREALMEDMKTLEKHGKVEEESEIAEETKEKEEKEEKSEKDEKEEKK